MEHVRDDSVRVLRCTVADENRIREMPEQFGFVLRVRFPSVTRKERNIVARREMAEDIVGPDLASRIDGDKLSVLHPEYFHWVS